MRLNKVFLDHVPLALEVDVRVQQEAGQECASQPKNGCIPELDMLRHAAEQQHATDHRRAPAGAPRRRLALALALARHICCGNRQAAIGITQPSPVC